MVFVTAPTNRRPRMASVAQTNRSDKQRALWQLDEAQVERMCQEKGHHFRDFKLPPGKTLRMFGWQMLMGNVTCDAVVHHANGAFSASAYCQARQRFPLEVLKEVSAGVVKQGSGLSAPRAGHTSRGALDP